MPHPTEPGTNAATRWCRRGGDSENEASARVWWCTVYTCSLFVCCLVCFDMRQLCHCTLAHVVLWRLCFLRIGSGGDPGDSVPSRVEEGFMQNPLAPGKC